MFIFLRSSLWRPLEMWRFNFFFVLLVKIYFSRTSLEYIDEEFKKNKSLSKDRKERERRHVPDRERHAEKRKSRAQNVACDTRVTDWQMKNKLFVKTEEKKKGKKRNSTLIQGGRNITGWLGGLFDTCVQWRGLVPSSVAPVFSWFWRAWAVMSAAVAAATAVFFTSSNDVDVLFRRGSDVGVLLLFRALSRACSTRE